MNKNIDLRDVFAIPFDNVSKILNILNSIKIGDQLRYETIKGNKDCFIEVVDGPFFSKQMDGVVIVFKREKMLIDYVVFDISSEVFVDNRERGYDTIDQYTKLLVTRTQKEDRTDKKHVAKIDHQLRVIGDKYIETLRDLHYPEEFVKKIVDNFPSKMRLNILNPHLRRKQKRKTADERSKSKKSKLVE